jgi:hypothetical protein
MVPRIVAFLIVVEAFSTLVLGIVALSIPRNAKNVKVVVVAMADKFDSELKFKGK